MATIPRSLLAEIFKPLVKDPNNRECLNKVSNILDANPDAITSIAFHKFDKEGIFIAHALEINPEHPLVNFTLENYQFYGTRMSNFYHAYPLDFLIVLGYDDYEMLNQITLKTLLQTAQGPKPYTYELGGLYFKDLLDDEAPYESPESLAEKILRHHDHFREYLNANPAAVSNLRKRGVNPHFWRQELDYKKLEAQLRAVSGQEQTSEASADSAEKKAKSGYKIHELENAPSMDEYKAANILQASLKEKLDEYVALQEYAAAAQAAQGVNILGKSRNHLIFKGNPGTGKTTLAATLGRYFHERGMLKKGHVVEVSAASLIGQYVGQTAPKVRAAFEAARGGILFIDEIYHFNETKFGQDAVTELIPLMENERDNFILIGAGYPKECDQVMELNPGWADRFGDTFSFENFSKAEIGQILKLKLAALKIAIDDDALQIAVNYLEEDKLANVQQYANARTAEKLLLQAIKKRAVRHKRHGSEDGAAALLHITATDVKAAVTQMKTDRRNQAQSAPLGFVSFEKLSEPANG